MKPAEAKIIKTLKTIAREDGWTRQRTKSMLGIFRSQPEYKWPEMLRAVIERRQA